MSALPIVRSVARAMCTSRALDSTRLNSAASAVTGHVPWADAREVLPQNIPDQALHTPSPRCITGNRRVSSLAVLAMPAAPLVCHRIISRRLHAICHPAVLPPADAVSPKHRRLSLHAPAHSLLTVLCAAAGNSACSHPSHAASARRASAGCNPFPLACGREVSGALVRAASYPVASRFAYHQPDGSCTGINPRQKQPTRSLAADYVHDITGLSSPQSCTQSAVLDNYLRIGSLCVEPDRASCCCCCRDSLHSESPDIAEACASCPAGPPSSHPPAGRRGPGSSQRHPLAMVFDPFTVAAGAAAAAAAVVALKVAAALGIAAGASVYTAAAVAGSVTAYASYELSRADERRFQEAARVIRKTGIPLSFTVSIGPAGRAAHYHFRVKDHGATELGLEFAGTGTHTLKKVSKKHDVRLARGDDVTPVDVRGWKGDTNMAAANLRSLVGGGHGDAAFVETSLLFVAAAVAFAQNKTSWGAGARGWVAHSDTGGIWVWPIVDAPSDCPYSGDLDLRVHCTSGAAFEILTAKLRFA